MVVFVVENYDKMLEKIIDNHVARGEVPRVLMHSCCAPCSSYVIEYLSKYFSIKQQNLLKKIILIILELL